MAERGRLAVPDATIAAVLAHAAARPPLLGEGRLVCIDGPAGSGKTTLAAALADATGARVLTMDDHYEGWQGLGDAPARIRDEILAPLASGLPGFYRRYDWDRNEFAELHVVEPSDLLILEGVGSGSRELAPYRATLVWVTAGADLRLERGLARDGEAAREHWLRWMDDEQAHFAAHGRTNGPNARATKFKGFQRDLDMVPLGPLKTERAQVMAQYSTIVDRYDRTVYRNLVSAGLEGVAPYNRYINHTPPYKWVIHPNWYTTAGYRAKNNGMLGRSNGCITVDPADNNKIITRLQGALVYVTVGDAPIEQYL